MSSSKSKKRSGSEIEESVHMDTDIPSEDHNNLPIEMRRKRQPKKNHQPRAKESK